MDKLQQVRAFQATVESGIAGLEGLIALLHEEQAALLSANGEALADVVQRKAAQLETLSHSSQARDHLLGSIGLPIGPPGAVGFLEQMKAPQVARETWERHHTLSVEAARLNEYNGRLAIQGERNTRKALSILTGRQTDTNTYGKDRKHSLSGIPRSSLAKA